MYEHVYVYVYNCIHAEKRTCIYRFAHISLKCKCIDNNTPTPWRISRQTYGQRCAHFGAEMALFWARSTPGCCNAVCAPSFSGASNVWQCVVVCGSVWQCGTVCGRVWQCVAVCCNALQCAWLLQRGMRILFLRCVVSVAAACSVLHCVALCCRLFHCAWLLQHGIHPFSQVHRICCSVFQRVAACSSEFGCVAICCTVSGCCNAVCALSFSDALCVLQHVVVYRNVLQCVAMRYIVPG